LIAGRAVRLNARGRLADREDMELENVLRALIVAAVALLFLVARRRRERIAMPDGRTPGPGEGASVLDLVAAGRKIDAIKRYRAEHRVGLREAKEAVEEMSRGLPR